MIVYKHRSPNYHQIFAEVCFAPRSRFNSCFLPTHQNLEILHTTIIANYSIKNIIKKKEIIKMNEYILNRYELNDMAIIYMKRKSGRVGYAVVPTSLADRAEYNLENEESCLC